MIDIHTNPFDATSDEVVEYLYHLSTINNQIIHGGKDKYGVKIFIDNEGSKVSILDSYLNEIQVERKSGWFWRGNLWLDHFADLSTLGNKIFEDHILKEINLLKDFFYSYSIKLGGFQKEIHNNRIHNILTARDCGIKVPATMVTSYKCDVLDFFQQYRKIITKPIHNGHLNFKENGMMYSCQGTTILEEIDVLSLESNFAPSLFQEYVEKEIEIRIFFIGSKFYPMAIFSQLDEQTKTDYRNYNQKKPNRNVPFILPLNLEKKLKTFFDKTDLHTGSVDIILTPENEYVFLEVNPTGQFGWVSKKCNYYIEKEVAKILIAE